MSKFGRMNRTRDTPRKQKLKAAAVEAYVKIKVKDVLYDAHNCTSIEEEIGSLVRRNAERLTTETLKLLTRKLKKDHAGK